jgi:hypothetical protein
MLIRTAALIACAVLTLRAQIPVQFQYQRLPNRYEGIRNGHQVAGERLELVSVIARVGLSSSQAPDHLILGFASDTNRNVSITVRDLDNNYWMEPTDENGNKDFKAKAGFNSFAWEGIEVKYIKRTAQDLYVLVQRIGGDDTLLLPAFVFDSASARPSVLQVKEYEFAFVPNAEATLSYQIQSSGGQTLQSDELQDLPEGEPIVIRWQPNGQTDGTYKLAGKATFHFRGGAPPIQQTISFSFYHDGKIHSGS